jgi:hypothetical protein
MISLDTLIPGVTFPVILILGNISLVLVLILLATLYLPS